MKSIQKPSWLKIRLPNNTEYLKVREIVNKNNLHTICSSGSCPNMGECWNAGTATLMILGNICTRSCKFCGVKTGKPDPIDRNEPMRVAESIKLMKLKHCVITSVDRDDLPDGGAQIWFETINAIKELNPSTTIETLIPDFQGKNGALELVMKAKPDIISHNLETVRRLTPEIRSKAKYDYSLEVLKAIVDAGLVAKSGIMVGIGETDEEVFETLQDLLNIGCKIITIGQYLRPSQDHLALTSYITPEKFEEYKTKGLAMGFDIVESAPLVRSSYHAEKHIK